MQKVIESEIIRQLIDGNTTAFKTIYDEYKGKIFRIAFSFLKNEVQSEEIVQETFINLWLNRTTLDANGNLYTDLQQWSEYRRTGHPEIPLTGSGLINNKRVPSRLNYPPYLQYTNGTNLADAVTKQGPDDFNTKMWWQRP